MREIVVICIVIGVYIQVIVALSSPALYKKAQSKREEEHQHHIRGRKGVGSGQEEHDWDKNYSRESEERQGDLQGYVDMSSLQDSGEQVHKRQRSQEARKERADRMLLGEEEIYRGLPDLIEDSNDFEEFDENSKKRKRMNEERAYDKRQEHEETFRKRQEDEERLLMSEEEFESDESQESDERMRKRQDDETVRKRRERNEREEKEKRMLMMREEVEERKQQEENERLKKRQEKEEERIRKRQEDEERMRKRQEEEEERIRKRQEEDERLKKRQEEEKEIIRKRQEDEEILRKRQEEDEERVRKRQEEDKRLRKRQEKDKKRARKRQEEEERLKKRQEEHEDKERRQHIDEWLRKQDDERLKNRQENGEEENEKSIRYHQEELQKLRKRQKDERIRKRQRDNEESREYEEEEEESGELDQESEETRDRYEEEESEELNEGRDQVKPQPYDEKLRNRQFHNIQRMTKKPFDLQTIWRLQNEDDREETEHRDSNGEAERLKKRLSKFRKRNGFRFERFPNRKNSEESSSYEMEDFTLEDKLRILKKRFQSDPRKGQEEFLYLGPIKEYYEEEERRKEELEQLRKRQSTLRNYREWKDFLNYKQNEAIRKRQEGQENEMKHQLFEYLRKVNNLRELEKIRKRQEFQRIKLEREAGHEIRRGDSDESMSGEDETEPNEERVRKRQGANLKKREEKADIDLLERENEFNKRQLKKRLPLKRVEESAEETEEERLEEKHQESGETMRKQHEHEEEKKKRQEHDDTDRKEQAIEEEKKKRQEHEHMDRKEQETEENKKRQEGHNPENMHGDEHCCGKRRSATDEPVFELHLSSDINLFWTVDYKTEKLTFEVHAKMEEKEWLAIGFSDYGELVNADFCLFWVDWKSDVHLEDSWTDSEGVLWEDKEQNCKHWRVDEHKNRVRFIFQREFDTCDEQDYVVQDGTTHVLYIRGQGPLIRPNGLNINQSESGMERVQLLKPLTPPPAHPPDTKILLVSSDKAEVPDDETTYWCHVVKLPEEMKRKHHIIQFEANIEAANTDIVHHMEVFHCDTDPDEDIPLYKGPCKTKDRPLSIDVCKKVLAAWAMGAEPFLYPEEAGLAVGGKDFNPYVMLEVHYNNPNHFKGRVDSSGLNLYYTSHLRRHDAGVMELGLEYTNKMAIPPNVQAFTLTGDCIRECTAVGLPSGGMYVFGSQLHTHLTGVKVVTRHIRNGRELPELNRDNHYSTHFQEIRRLKRHVHVLPGDSLLTTCYHTTTDRPNVTVGGFAISDEMCVNYIHYFPRSSLEVCKSSIDSDVLDNYFRFMNEWEIQNTSPNKGVRQNYESIEWTPLRSLTLSDLYATTPLSMQCNQSNGDRFPGNWEGMKQTVVLHPLPEPERPCPSQ